MRTLSSVIRRTLPLLALGLLLGIFLSLLLLGVASSLSAEESTGERGEPGPGIASPHGRLSTPCTDCHTTEAWRPLAEPLPFDHSDTGFELIASHRPVACLDCHESLNFAWVGTACADCHADPHLGALGLSCADCHDVRGWQEARRQMLDLHATTLFPLTGAHAAADCESCHRGGPPHEFSATPTDCFSCHADDYRRTRRPNHVSAGFPLACETCHRTSEWEGARFPDHDARFFPIFSGPHQGVWSACSDCHTSNTFQTFNCLTCHPRDEMDDEHDDVGGYVYQSIACFSCHPRGRE